MMPAALQALRAPSTVSSERVRAKPLPIGLSPFDDALPEGGLPRGSIVEIAAARGLGRATTVALSVVASAQRLACLRSGDARTRGAWCAFVDPFSTLHAPGLAATEVDPTRLLVVRPPVTALARTSLKLVASKVFAVVVLDLVPTLGTPQTRAGEGASSSQVPSFDKLCTLVRRLAIANEKSDATVVLLTDSLVPRSTPLPVAMRIDVERRSPLAPGTVHLVAANQNVEDAPVASAQGDEIWMRVVKERRGRVRPASKVEIKKAAHLVRVEQGT